MGILLEELHTSNNTHKHTHTSMSSAHAPQNLPADLNESSQQHELADGCDDADTYLSASLTRCLFFLSSQSLSFFWGSLVVHTSDLSLGLIELPIWFFVSSRIAFFCPFATKRATRGRRFRATRNATRQFRGFVLWENDLEKRAVCARFGCRWSFFIRT